MLQLFKRRKENEIKHYGEHTIHSTGHLDVEVDDEGNVIAIWYRCITLPFRQVNISNERKLSLSNSMPDISITGIDYRVNNEEN